MSTFNYNRNDLRLFYGPQVGEDKAEGTGTLSSMVNTMNRGKLNQWQSRGYTMFNDDHIMGRREAGAMTGAKMIQADRRSGFSGTLGEFQAETTRFNRDFEASETLRLAMDDKFAKTDANMQTMLEGLGSNPSKASSIGQFQMLAKNSMQETQRAMNKLSGMKAPDLIDLPTTFKDPFTGEDVPLGTKFEDMYEADDPKAMANAIVNRKFKTASQATARQLEKDLRGQLGDAYDFDDATAKKIMAFSELNDNNQDAYVRRDMGAISSNTYALQQSAGEMVGVFRDLGMDDVADRTERMQRSLSYSNSYNAGAAEHYRDTSAELHQLAKGLRAKSNITEYSEANALAQMSGMVRNGRMSFKDNSGNAQTLDPTEYYLGSDKNAELAKMKKFTESKLAIEFRSEEASFSKEFENRVMRAEQEVEAGIRNKELNAIRSGSIDAQKRQLQERLTKQQNEYESTLAGLASGGGSPDTGVIMTDNRPS